MLLKFKHINKKDTFHSYFYYLNINDNNTYGPCVSYNKDKVLACSLNLGGLRNGTRIFHGAFRTHTYNIKGKIYGTIFRYKYYKILGDFSIIKFDKYHPRSIEYLYNFPDKLKR